jgi:hypothetical protein
VIGRVGWFLTSRLNAVVSFGGRFLWMGGGDSYVIVWFEGSMM